MSRGLGDVYKRQVHYYAGFGFVSEGVSGSTHGGVVWYQMRLKF